ncbi:hypothetical protein PHLCEN_2v960 [Hermanssonia centrifuga]|uniref:Uncharacterized protein n=1 Tax=Hermanssonia centrifuga TaxID=98765 RepID=A0A2R6S4P5_9APHY|nr:hypothetical protein PHLCEN_2v960 [Hermanssonia centrifuga]
MISSAQRRVRHITSIQVRNLTPFPARDEFASALSQPSERPQFGAHGHLSDDLDVTLGRKRGRRRSSTSLSNVITQGYLDLDTGVGDSAHSMESTPRKRTISRASTSTVMGTGLSPGSKGRPTSKGPFTARPGHRQRTISASSSNSLLTSSATSAERLLPSSFRGFLRDTSQAGLEGIIGSRLVETFITMTTYTEMASDSASVRYTALDGPAPSDNNTSRPEHAKPPARRNTLALSENMTPRASLSPSRDLSSTPGSRGSQLAGTSSERGRARSASVLTNRRGVSKPPHVKILSQKTPNARASTPLLSNGSIALSQSKRVPPSTNPCPTTPDYLSPIHRPSTNPSFHVDARDGFDFAPGADLDCPRMHVEIWGRISQSLTASVQDKRKGKEKEKAGAQGDVSLESDVQWSILERWDVNLNDLIPLPEDLASHPSRFASNTLCITLDPPGQTFYLPTTHSSSTPTLRSRSPSPSGYNSDPESGGHQIKPPLPSILVGLAANDQSSTARLSRRKGETRSPSWQDLLRLVTLQAVIRDTEDSLTEVVHEIDTHVVNNTPSVLIRELSENEAWLNELQTETNAVRKESDVLRSRLRTKTEELRKRKEILIQAHTVHEQDLEDEEDTAIDIREEKQQLDLLRSRLPPIRNALFTTLAFIYPIELVSPPDLLFSILDVPLPIPNGPTDPAPPLSVPSHKDVTEEAVATALGYAAQTVHLLATYLGKNLMYPVTCIGSRSIIKDGISAMVGPRM